MPTPTPLAPFSLQVLSRATVSEERSMPSPVLKIAVHPWIVLPGTIAKPIPVVVVRPAFEELLLEAVQWTMVQPKKVPNPAELAPGPRLPLAEQPISEQPVLA